MNIFGTEGRDELFGTNRSDYIFGRGNLDFISANGGRDVIVGSGNIDAGRGDDTFFNYYFYNNYGQTATDVRLGEGNDVALVAAGQPLYSGVHWGGGLMDIHGEEGDDVVILAGQIDSHAQVYLGDGADTAYLMSQPSVSQIWLGRNEIGEIGDRDVVHYDGHGQLSNPFSIYDFGKEDLLVIYDTGLSYKQLRQRMTSEDGSSVVRVSLPNGPVLEVRLEFSDGSYPNIPPTKIPKKNIKLVDTPLAITDVEIIVSPEEGYRKVYIGSGADEVRKSRGIETVFLGAGDDLGRGNRKENFIFGEDGADRLVGKGGDDALYGGLDNDTLIGGAGDDFLAGNHGANFVNGGSGADTIYVQGRQDIVKGGAGKDRIEILDSFVGIGPEADKRPDHAQIYGGKGDDFFVFHGNNSDVVLKDFNTRREVIDLSYLSDNLTFEDIIRNSHDVVCSRKAIMSPMSKPEMTLSPALGTGSEIGHGMGDDERARVAARRGSGAGR